jgi:NTP pyrophosphatase (non-canonical NTP hydrolase)
MFFQLAHFTTCSNWRRDLVTLSPTEIARIFGVENWSPETLETTEPVETTETGETVAGPAESEESQKSEAQNIAEVAWHSLGC